MQTVRGLMLRVSADDPILQGLFSKQELAGLRKLQRVKRGKRKGELTTEQEIELGIESRGLDAGMSRQFMFDPTGKRKWRFDFAWPDIKVAVEYEGLVMRKVNGVWQVGGGHATITGMREDMIKYNAAALLGWRVFRYERELVRNGTIWNDLFKVLIP